jgi:hypothetical protein
MSFVQYRYLIFGLLAGGDVLLFRIAGVFEFFRALGRSLFNARL